MLEKVSVWDAILITCKLMCVCAHACVCVHVGFMTQLYSRFQAELHDWLHASKLGERQHNDRAQLPAKPRSVRETVQILGEW